MGPGRWPYGVCQYRLLTTGAVSTRNSCFLDHLSWTTRCLHPNASRFYVFQHQDMTRFQSNWLTLKELNCLFHVSLMNLCKMVDLLRTNSHPGILLESLVRSLDDVTCYEGGGDMVPSSRQPGQYKFHSIIFNRENVSVCHIFKSKIWKGRAPLLFHHCYLTFTAVRWPLFKKVYLPYIHGVFDSCSSCRKPPS